MATIDPRIAALILCTAALPCRADPAPPPVAPTVATRTDAAQRMTVPVTIGTHGPFQFIVDTGSDRTVVSRELAERLNLAPGEGATLHSMSGVGRVATVRVPELGLAGRSTLAINAPALAEINLGASGLLGIDSLKGRRIVMDFRKRTLTIAEPGATERDEPGTIVVTARSRYGQLILVDADVDGLPVTVIVDSGAQNSIGNTALRDILGRRRKSLQFARTDLIDVTGGRIPADIAAVDRIRIGGVTLNGVVIAFADAHPFRRFGIDKRPAMLLGMDTLRAFSRVSVDFAKRKVRFLLPGEG
jgi:predicted aspartyl protease